MLKCLNTSIFLLILLYPCTYAISFIANIGHFYELIHFVIISFLFFLGICFNKKIVIEYIVGLSLILLLIVWGLSFNGISSVRPYYFLMVFILGYVFFFNNPSFYFAHTQYKTFLFCFCIFLILSLVFIFFPHGYIDNGGRFKGFLLSPTHYSIYVLVMMVFVSAEMKNTFIKLMLLMLLAFFVYFSKTRLSFGVMGLFVIIFIFKGIINKHLKLSVAIILILFIFFYPIYDVVGEYISIARIRYADNVDLSLNLRLNMTDILLDKLKTSSLREILIGSGAESARNLIFEHYKRDLFPHNDFIRLLIDFGIIGCGIYLFLIAYLASKNIYAFCIYIIYLSGFYHNMLYSFYLIIILIYFSLYNKYKNLHN